MAWTEEDQARVDRYTQDVRALLRESGIDLQAAVIAHVQTVGTLMRDDLEQHPDRLGFYLAALARLVDHVAPMRLPEANVMH